MAAAVSTPLPRHTISTRKLEANRRNAKRSTGPRTAEGKARVARNAVKHGFFASIERWCDEDRGALDEILEGLRDEFKPTDAAQDRCVVTIAASTVRLAMAWRYEAVAAQEHHLKCERDLNDRIAVASPPEAQHLEATHATLKAAGLWCPILPDERTMRVIARYEGNANRLRTCAYSTLVHLQEANAAIHAATPGFVKMQKQTHRETSPSGVLSASQRTSRPPISAIEIAKTNPPRLGDEARPPNFESAKTNPSMAILT